MSAPKRDGIIQRVEVMIQNKQEFLALVQRHEDRIRDLGVKRLGLFGSFTRGEQNQDSDVDVLVEFERDQKTFDQFIHLASLLEDLFKRRIEVVTPESLSTYLRPYITRNIEYVTFRS